MAVSLFMGAQWYEGTHSIVSLKYLGIEYADKVKGLMYDTFSTSLTKITNLLMAICSFRLLRCK